MENLEISWDEKIDLENLEHNSSELQYHPPYPQWKSFLQQMKGALTLIWQSRWTNGEDLIDRITTTLIIGP